MKLNNFEPDKEHLFVQYGWFYIYTYTCSLQLFHRQSKLIRLKTVQREVDPVGEPLSKMSPIVGVVK